MLKKKGKKGKKGKKINKYLSELDVFKGICKMSFNVFATFFFGIKTWEIGVN